MDMLRRLINYRIIMRSVFELQMAYSIMLTTTQSIMAKLSPFSLTVPNE